MSSSRIIVKNLPKYISEDRLKEHFQRKGEVTDACIIKTKSGESRRFGFIGYINEEQAQQAVKYFHQTYLDTSRIMVDIALSHGSESIDRPWSKYSKGSSRYEQEHKVETIDDSDKLKDLKEKSKENIKEKDGLFEEFLEAVQPRSQSKFWSNDDGINPEATKEVERKSSRSQNPLNVQEIEKLEENNLLLNKEDKDIVNDKDVSDLSYLKSKINHNEKNMIQKDEDRTDQENEENENENVIKKNNLNEQDITNRLFLRNLSYTITEDDLRELFSPFGQIDEVHIPLDEMKRVKGFGFISYQSPIQAKMAMSSLDGKAFQGRLLHVIPGKPKQENEDGMNDNNDNMDKNLSYKEKKEIERRANAKNSDGWNASFIRGDTTVNCLSSRFNVNKGDILDKGSNNMAVRLAIGETLLLKENKEFFIKEGVDLNAIEGTKSSSSNIQRSTQVILIKNLPYTSQKEELNEMFSVYGNITRFLMPPSNTLALVEYTEPSEARKAFRKLAYKKYQHVPLYLEWAPIHVFQTKLQTNASTLLINKENKEEEFSTETTSLKSKTSIQEMEIEDDNAVEQYQTIFVKNLSFSTQESSLQKVFEKVGDIRSITIAKKKNPKLHTKEPMLSMGFGFIEYKSKEGAEKAIQSFQGIKVDGHALQLKLSKKKLTNVPKPHSASSSSKKLNNKLIVRNVAFEATIKDIRELFGTFGQLKQVRIPKKFDGRHRGFAFVEFLTEQEAKNAFSSLTSSHLYGRHLVLEWAKDMESIEDLREKATRDIASINDANHRQQNKKRKQQEKEEKQQQNEF